MPTNTIPALDLTPTGHLPHIVDQAAARDEERLTCLAAALYVATAGYNEALTMDNPATVLDDMCDALPEIMPDVCKVVDAAREFADVLKAAVADNLAAFAAIENARIEAGDGYGYLFDVLADHLRNGASPSLVRQTALDSPGRLRDLAEQARA